MGKIAFVIPWYGVNIPGGSETACRNLAERMVKQGRQVEILTTCVKQFDSDWSQNYYKSGNEILNGVLVRRFRANKRNVQRFDGINYKLMNKHSITSEEENIFLEEMVNSEELVHFIDGNKNDYQAILYIPYMFGTTYHGIERSLDKAILLPAFHDEAYAYLDSFRNTYSRVKGMVFFSNAEQDWAQKHYNLTNVKQDVLGLGIDDFKYDGDRFRNKFNMNVPYILYAGRKDYGKNVHVLLDYFSRFKQENNFNDLKLVLIGGGTIEIPVDVEEHVIDLGFVDEQDKFDAYAASEFLCNPSPNESFSLVIMESWYAERPVLVFEECHVTKRFCEESNGGLYFGNYDEFEACTQLLLTNKELSKGLGFNGKWYVQANFQWNHVIERYLDFINKCFKEPT